MQYESGRKQTLFAVRLLYIEANRLPRRAWWLREACSFRDFSFYERKKKEREREAWVPAYLSINNIARGEKESLLTKKETQERRYERHGI